MFFNKYSNVEVAIFSAPLAGFAFVFYPDDLVVVNAGRNKDASLFQSLEAALSPANLAGFFWFCALALAFRTSNHGGKTAQKSSSYLLNLALAAAGKTFFGAAARFRAQSLATVAMDQFAQRDFFFVTGQSFGQINLNDGFNILALSIIPGLS